jgi:hypothetical protein
VPSNCRGAYGPAGRAIGRRAVPRCGVRGWVKKAQPCVFAVALPRVRRAGPSISGFEQVRNVVAATRIVQTPGNIILVDRFATADVAAWYAGIGARYPGRIIVGLGVAQHSGRTVWGSITGSGLGGQPGWDHR